MTEDADLGIRLVRYGYKVGTLDSDTTEEAPHEFKNWLAQRVRWQKGWMQTCIVHSRKPSPASFATSAYPGPVAAAILMFGAVVSALLWPVFTVTMLWRAFGPGAADRCPAGAKPRTCLSIFSLVAGVGGSSSPAIVAARQRRLEVGAAPSRSFRSTMARSRLAAWTAIVDLIVRPHFWAKTEHGRMRRRAVPAPMLRRDRSDRAPVAG